MNNSIYRVCLDIHTTHSQVQLEASKGDNARLIEFTLTDGGAIYSVADDCTAIFRAQKPSGAVLFNSCTIAGDRIKCQMTNQTTAEVGTLQCELEVIGADSKVLTAPRFTIRVADTVYSDDEVESEDEFTQLQTAIIQVGNVDIDCSKVGHTATVTITDKTGTQKSVNIYDGDAGQGGDVTITGDASGNLTSITAGEDTYSVAPVSGTKTGTNWTELTIGGTTGGLVGNESANTTIPLESGWQGADVVVERGGRTCVLKLVAQYKTGGTICVIPSAYRSIFAGSAIGYISRNSTGVGVANLNIQSTGEVTVSGVYGTTLEMNDYIYAQAVWVR